MAALFFALALGQSFDAASAAAAQRRKAFLVGVVLPRHANPGSQISGRVVANPDDIAQDPRLIVEHVTLTLPADDSGKPILNDAFVDTGDGRQSAAGRITARVPADGSRIKVACGETDAPERAKHLDVPVEPPSANVKASSHGYSMLPLESDAGVMAINGPYDGDSATTQVTVNGKPAAVVAESPDAAYFTVGDTAHKGRNRVVLKQHGRAVAFDMFEAEVSIAADRTTLKEHESAHFKVTVDGLQEMPAKDWRAGNPADLYDTTSAVKNARDFTPPPTGAEGVVMLTIANRSEQIVTMTPANNYSVPLTHAELERGPKIVEGEVTADQAGVFMLDASLVPLLAEAPGVEQPGGPRELARAENTPTPRSEQTPVPHSGEKETPRNEETPTEHRDYGPPVVLVPGAPEVPLVAPPKCCVITSLTVTNNEAYPVYYVINGRYQPGKAPPLDQWVQPGKSVTFKGDLGVCVRIEAFQDRGYDENGEPLTGLFDDETVCCKDLVSGKIKGKRFTYTINSVEWREWRDCPEKPPKIGAPPKIVIRPTRTPTPTRTRTPTPTVTETETPTPTATETPEIPGYVESPVPVTPPPEAEDCPERGRGCAALVIDLFKVELDRKLNEITSDPNLSDNLKDAYRKVIYHDRLDDVVKRLDEMHCKIVPSYPDFWPHPEPFTITLGNGAPLTIRPAPGLVQLVIQHNKDEWSKVNAADQEHIDDLRKGWEIVFEIVSAHGGPRYEWGTLFSCGSWGQDFDDDGEFYRWRFHQAHYWALKYKVCDWVVYDSSCFSGLTPQAIDGLENANHQRCTGEPTVNCNQHAGYEGDLATGTSPSTDTCIGGHTFDHFEKLTGALTMPIDKSSPYGGAILDDLANVLGATPRTPPHYRYRPSYYRDKGYNGDRPPPPEHPRKYLYATMTPTFTPTATPTP